MLYPFCLPSDSEEDEDLWREFSQPEQIHITITFQARLPDKDLEELRKLRERLKELTERAANRMLKGWDDTIIKYGFIRLPDYLSATSAIFIEKNTDNVWIKPKEPLEVVSIIDKELSTRFNPFSTIKQEKTTDK